MLISGIISCWIFFLYLFNANFSKKSILLLAVNLLLISMCNYFDKIFCLKLITIFNFFAITIHNHKFKSSCILYISIVSTGFLMLTIKELNQELIPTILTSTYLTNSQAILANEIYTLIAITLIIGCIPFSEKIMYLFSISNIMFKIPTFIIPMYISLLILQDLAQTFSADSFKILGTIICLYSSICFSFNNSLKVIFSNIIVYFYGLQILLLAQTKTLTFLYLWLIVVALVLLSCSIYAPKRVAKYSLKNMFVNSRSELFIIVFIITFIIAFLNNLFILNVSTIHSIALASIPSYIFGKIIRYSLSEKKITLQKKQIKNKKMSSVYLFFLITSLYLFEIQTCARNYTLFITQPYHLAVIISAISVAIVLGFIFAQLKQPHFLIIKTYSHMLIIIMQVIKIICLISKSVVIDFFCTTKSTIANLSLSKTLEKISNILYGNNTYFYALFFLEIIVILTIEFIIL